MKPIEVKNIFYEKFFSNRCKIVLQCYNQLEVLIYLNNSVTPRVLQGVTSVTKSLYRETFNLILKCYKCYKKSYGF